MFDGRIKVYTNQKYFPDGMPLVSNHDKKFDGDTRFFDLGDENGECARLINVIDGAILRCSDNLMSRYEVIPRWGGIVDIEHISTGAKTAINILLNQDNSVIYDLRESGANAIEEILRISDKSKLHLYIPHYNVPSDLKYRCVLNNEILMEDGDWFAAEMMSCIGAD